MRGFTLLETVIALMLIGLTLSVVFSLLSQGIRTVDRVKENWKDFTYLDKTVKLGMNEGVSIEEKELKEYEIKVKVYRRGNVELILLE